MDKNYKVNVEEFLLQRRKELRNKYRSEIESTGSTSAPISQSALKELITLGDFSDELLQLAERSLSPQDVSGLYRDILYRNSSNVILISRFARHLHNSGSAEEAIRILLDAVKSIGYSSPVCHELGYLYFKHGRFDLAAPNFEFCFWDAAGHQHSALIFLAEIFDRLEKLLSIKQLCTSIQAESSIYNTAQRLLAFSESRLGEHDAAISRLMPLVDCTVDNIEFVGTLVDVYRRCKKYGNALSLISAALASNMRRREELLLPYIDLLHLSGKDVEAANLINQLAGELAEPISNHGVSFPIRTRLLYSQTKASGNHPFNQEPEFGYRTGPIQSSNATSIDFFCIVIGSTHVKYMLDASLPSLFSLYDFDEISGDYAVRFNIYTTPQDYSCLEPIVEMLSKKNIPCFIDTSILSKSFDFYSILSLCVLHQVRSSVARKSIVICALPDLIMCGSLRIILDKLTNSDVVVCPAPRVDATKAYNYLKNEVESGYRQHPGVLAKKSFSEFIHPQTIAALRNPNPRLEYRLTNTGVFANNFCPPPVAFRGVQYMIDSIVDSPLCGPTSMSSFFCIDHDFVHHAYTKGRLELIENNNHFFWMELTDIARHADFLGGSKSEDYYYPESCVYLRNIKFEWNFVPSNLSVDS